MAHIDLTALQPILQYEDFQSLPVTFHPDSDLERVTDFLTNALFLRFERLTEDKPELTKAAFLDVVTTFMTEAQSDTELSLAFRDLDTVATSLYTHYKAASTQLKHTLAPAVESLRDRIDAQMSVHLRRRGADMLAPTEDAAPTFTRVDWDAFQLYGGKAFIAEEIGQFIGFALDKTQYSESILQYIVNKLEPRLEDIDLTDGEFDEAVKQIEALDTGEDPEQPNPNGVTTEACLRILLSSAAYRLYLQKVTDRTSGEHPADKVIRYNHDLKHFQHVIRSIHRTSVQFSDEQVDAINRNIQRVRKMLLCEQYQMLYADQVYADALLLSPTHLNGPVLDAYLKDGGTEDDIHQYVVMCEQHNRVIPRTGITLQWYLGMQEKTKEEYAAYQDSLQLQKQTLLAEAKTKGFDIVCCEHMQTLAQEKTATALEATQFCKNHYPVIASLKNQLYGDDTNTEDVLYQYLFGIQGVNYLTQDLYKKYQQESKAILAQESDIDDAVHQQMEYRIQMTTLVDLLYPLLMVHKKK